ncbi:hypothetical protein FACS1894166_12220 [Bacilli bacterium]|nr:hypothetical protein FACS1894166_12220 [Bacilli bacterium]
MDLDFSTTANVTLGKDCFVDCSNITKFVMPASGILKTKFHDVAFRTTFSPIKSIIFDQKYKTITHPF